MSQDRLLEALHQLSLWLDEQNLREGLQDVTLHFKNKGLQYAALFSIRRTMHEYSFVIKSPLDMTAPQEINGLRLRITGAGEEAQLYQQGIRVEKDRAD